MFTHDAINHLEMIARIALSALLGGAIGLERDMHGRPAGLRTHILVCMGSATFMVMSLIEGDGARIAANVVTGIGFLAGGAILKTGLSVQGLTTAAGLWLVAAIGLCIGAGTYPEGIAVTLMGLIVLTVLRYFQDKDDKVIDKHVHLTMENVPGQISGLADFLKASNVSVSDFDYEYRNEKQEVSLSFEAHLPVSMGTKGLVELLQKRGGIRHLHVQQRHVEKG